jgi:competence ComEA-like helix-hairpin-helix protein
MSDFQDKPTSASSAALDPFKHVKYNLGMVLGVDDFDQEFAYLSHRDQWLGRDTIGYGTVCGLKVSIEIEGEKGPRVVVEPGVAINPRGQLIRVTPAQCAYLNDWLAAAANREAVAREYGSPPIDELHLYVVLCYRDCPTDDQPVAGEPCRTEEEATVATRLKDDFKLQLSLRPPDQTEEKAVRDFVNWLGQIKISDTAISVSLSDLLTEVRNATYLLQSPPASPPSPPDFMYGSPPAWLEINTADACDYLRASFRVWVTELRPLWRGPSCDGTSPLEDCVLLAELHVPLDNGVVDSAGAIVVDEQQRPFLIHLRLLQEWLLCGVKYGASNIDPATGVVAETAFGQLPNAGADVDHYALADHTHGTPDLPDVPVPGNTVVSETAFGQAATAGIAATFSRVDHTHGTPALPDIPGAGSTVVSETAFGQAATAGIAATFSRVDHTHGTPALPAIPGPGSTVVSETAFGQAATAGIAATFSRVDHTHGTPALPAIPGPGSTVVSETAFGQAATAGIAATFSRVDHTHGTPALPAIPGPSDTVVSETLFGQTPRAGISLRYSRADHTHGTPAGGTGTGDFVEHPAGLPRYLIVAAGIARADGSDPTPGREPNYNGLQATAVGDGVLSVKFTAYEEPAGEFQYIVKAMPVFDPNFWSEVDIKQPVVNFHSYGKNELFLYVTDLGNPIPSPFLRQLEFVIEVSQYFGTSVPDRITRMAGAERPLVNLNSATADELRTLPRIGPDLAKRIVKARGRKGFASYEDLLNVPGIGEETLRIIQPFVTLGDS